MKIGIIAAMPQELKILVEALKNGEKHLSVSYTHLDVYKRQIERYLSPDVQATAKEYLLR